MDRAKLVAMLEYRLSEFSDELDDFVSEFFAELDGPDKYGNYSKIVGENPQKLFVCDCSFGSPYNGKNSIVVDGDKVEFGNDDYLKDILERAATLTKLSQSELIRNACLGQYVPMLQTASVPKRR